MTTATFTGGLTVKYGDGASPEVFAPIEEVQNLSNLGITNPLIDVTHHASAAREYIAGLPDGAELTIECNRVHTASNVQDDVIDEVIAKTTFNLEVTITDGTVAKVYTFAFVPTGWNVAPSYEDKTMLTITGKISGAIVES